ncbi:hypothetical protein AB4Z01_31400 [Inquilinus sp. YAF38]|uniref:hypothetical protein n=1 Tax=Inquilinus sp. YAF38 TaxID=3233084 RepID=UPI003F90A4BC
MKLLVAAVAILLAGLSCASAQELDIPAATYPALPRQAASAEGFVPPGWQLEAQAKGDLDGNGKADLAFVLHATDPKNVVANPEGLGVDSLDTNPRILAVAFARAAGYELAMENHALIPRRTDPVMDDPFDSVAASGLEVARGTLRLRLGVFASAGSWSMSTTTMTFRWQGGRFELIGYDRTETNRGSGEIEGLSINYLTRRAKRSQGTIESDAEKTRWETLPRGPLLSLDEVGDGLAFDPDSRR